MKKLSIGLLLCALASAQILGGGSTTATVTTSGTAVRLSTSNIQTPSFAVQLTTGTATVCVGGSNVSAASGIGTCVTGTGQNIYFAPSGTRVYDLSAYWVDASANSTIVEVTYNAAQ